MNSANNQPTPGHAGSPWGDRIAWSVFPKFYQHLDVPGLASLIKGVGLDTTDVVIRDGFWVAPGNICQTLPAFVSALGVAGIQVRFATTGLMPAEMVGAESPLPVLADNGITDFRMGYFKWDKQSSPAHALDAARRQMELVAKACEKYGLRAVYQVHHGTLISGAWVAWHLVRDLPPSHVGVMLDPGNQVFEGWDNWLASARLLGPHLVAMGIKDGGVYRDQPQEGPTKGWRRCLGITLGEGLVNWYDVARALKSVNFSGWFDFMPFYDREGPQIMTAKLKSEVEYLRRVISSVSSEAI